MTATVSERLSAAQDSDAISNLSAEFMHARLKFAEWYDAKSEDEQELIDAISDRTCFIIDEHEYDEFIETLDSYGIQYAAQFEDAFDSEREGTGERVQAEFAEELYDAMGMMPEDAAILHSIDWERVYSYALQYDFMEIEFKGNTYFMHNSF